MSLPKDFDWKIYLELNDDLQKKKLNKEQCERHYINNGMKKNRKYKYEIPNDFEWNKYIELHEDLKTILLDEESAINHYLNYGMREKRSYKVTLPGDFEWEKYLKINPDLKEHCSNKESCELHYFNYGYFENRQYKVILPDDFDWEKYLKMNPDIKEHCSDKESCEVHYINYGYFENRQCKVILPDDFDWKKYLKINPDIKEHCSNKESCELHYINYGYFENRIFNSSIESIKINDCFLHFSGCHNDFNHEKKLIDYNYLDITDFSTDSNFSTFEYKKIRNIKKNLFGYNKNFLENIYVDSFILLIDFPNYGGGAQQFINSLISKYKNNQTLIILRNINNLIEISINDDYILTKKMNDTEIVDYLELHKNKIKKIFVNHTLKHNSILINKLFTLEKEITTISHDLYLICKKPQLYFHQINDQLKNHDSIILHKYDNIILQNKCNLSILEPFIDTNNRITISPLPDVRNSSRKILTNNTKIVVGIIGSISPQKGGELLKMIVDHLNDNFELVIFGNCHFQYDNVYEYNTIEELNKLLINHKPNLLLELSLWPETYSYTLTLAMKTQLPIVALKKNFLSVIEKRLEDYDKTFYFKNFKELENLIKNVKQNYFYIIEPIFYYNSFWDEYFLNKKIENNNISFESINNKNIVLITSKIYVSDKKFSYIENRSIYTSQERFIQTIETIDSIRKYIPDSFIVLFDNSADFTTFEKHVFQKITDCFINILDDSNLNYHTNECEEKAYGDISQQVKFFDLLLANNINISNIKHFFKISGRYVINNNFIYKDYNNNKNLFKKDENNPKKEYYFTCFFKLDKNILIEYYNKLKKLLLEKTMETDNDCEIILPRLIKNNITKIKNLGITQRIAVWKEISNI